MPKQTCCGGGVRAVEQIEKAKTIWGTKKGVIVKHKKRPDDCRQPYGGG